MMFSTKTTLAVLTTLATLSTIGCQKNAEQAKNQIDQSAQQLNIRARWQNACGTPAVDVFHITSRIEKLDIGDSFQKTTTYFQENNCQTPLVSVVENGGSTVGAKVPGDNFLFDGHIDSVSITAMNQAGADALNTLVFCNHGDWAVGQARDVTADTQAAVSIAPCWEKTPRNIYDITRVDGDQLKFGLNKDGLDKTTAEKRPTEIDQSVVYIKQ